MFYLFESDRMKNKKMLIFRHTAFQLRQISKRGSTLAACNSTWKPPYSPLAHIFWTQGPSGHEGGFTRYHLIYTIPIKKLSIAQWANCDWVIRFLGSGFEVGSQDYIAESAIFKLWVFWVISVHCTTLYVIDILVVLAETLSYYICFYVVSALRYYIGGEGSTGTPNFYYAINGRPLIGKEGHPLAPFFNFAFRVYYLPSFLGPGMSMSNDIEVIVWIH